MPKIFNLSNPNYSSNTNCNNISPVTADLREREGSFCKEAPEEPCNTGRRKIFGQPANCDPAQSGSIINDITKKPNRDVVNRYTNALRGHDEAMLGLFKNLVVLDEDGHPKPVPIIYGTQEKAVAWILQNNTRKDNSLVVDRIPLPLLAIHQSGIDPANDRFIYHNNRTFRPGTLGQPLYQTELKKNDTIYSVSMGKPVNINYILYAWTMYVEDMNQIVEQILLKFSPLAYIQVQDVYWEIWVDLDSVANNLDLEPGDKKERVIKYQFNLKVQSYIPQPIFRHKTVLNIKTDFVNTVNENMTEVFDRQEVSAND